MILEKESQEPSMIVTEWTHCRSPAYTLQETLQVKHCPKTNLTPDLSRQWGDG